MAGEKTTLARDRKGGEVLYLINDVSRIVNLSQKRIREYEKEGLIKPLRENSTNNRLFTPFDVAQIKQINGLIHNRGFTLSCIKNLMVVGRCWDIFDCEKREDCPAYQLPWRPCYEMLNDQGNPNDGRCSRCPIYLNRNVTKEKILEKVPWES